MSSWTGPMKMEGGGTNEEGGEEGEGREEGHEDGGEAGRLDHREETEESGDARESSRDLRARGRGEGREEVSPMTKAAGRAKSSGGGGNTYGNEDERRGEAVDSRVLVRQVVAWDKDEAGLARDRKRKGEEGGCSPMLVPVQPWAAQYPKTPYLVWLASRK